MLPMFEVMLYEPEIPPNTGNIIRLCANSGCALSLIEPLGFSLSEKAMRRAGLDYHQYADLQVYADWQQAQAAVQTRRVFAFTTRGTTRYDQVDYQAGDVFLFGPETRGLPESILGAIPIAQHIRLPMQAHSRSLNLANTAAIAVYEAWRQHGFTGGV